MLKIREDSTNYTCTVIKLPVKQSIPGLDNLVQVDVFGNTCLIGKDSSADGLYLFFPAGCQLSQPFLTTNNLYREAQFNANPNEKGFFEPNGRCKGLKLKGIVSTGFVIPISSLFDLFPSKQFTQGIEHLVVGAEFNEFSGIEICRKYVPVGTVTQSAKGDKQGKVNNKLSHLLIPTQFRFHPETTHLAKNLHNINPNDIIVITDKWHGCLSENSILDTKEYGKITIGEIVTKKLKCSVKSFDFNTRKEIYSKISDFYVKENSGDWYEIELENGSKLQCTSNHPFWLEKYSCYRECSELTVLDSLSVS